MEGAAATSTGAAGRGGENRRVSRQTRLRGIYPQSVSGPIRRIKWVALVGLLAIYYLAPWLRWERAGDAPDQAILLDFATRRIYFFWIELWPQDMIVATGIMVFAAVGLFMATALYGRLWCGFTCPQTVWTDLFMLVERWIEGDRSARMRLDAHPDTPGRLGKKLVKHLAWLVIAFLTGGAFVLYFGDAPTLAGQFFVGEAPAGAYLFAGVLTATTYLMAGWAREKVCTHMCPWPRIQSALLDRDSLVVTYQDWRGEPRGKVKEDLRPSLKALEGAGALARPRLIEMAEAAAAGASAGEPGRGDCIDCHQCVVVCPTGIDIRNGLQLECIGCGLCVDACNAIMDKVGRPHGLIAYDSERNHQARSRGDPPVGMRRFRPRTVVYAAILAVVATLVVFGFSGRNLVQLSIIPDRQPLYVQLSDGSIRNTYTVRVVNKHLEPMAFDLELAGMQGLSMRLGGPGGVDGAAARIELARGDVGAWTVFVTAPYGLDVAGRNDLYFVLKPVAAPGEPVITEPSYFWGPD